MKTGTVPCRPLWERSARHDFVLPSFWSWFSKISWIVDLNVRSFLCARGTAWFACGQLSGLFESAVNCVSELAAVCVRESAVGCLSCRGSTVLLVAMKLLALLSVFLTETLDTVSFSLTTRCWTATYRKVQMSAMALYTDFPKEFFTFTMSTVSRYAGDGNLMTPIGKTCADFHETWTLTKFHAYFLYRIFSE
jgi:hypothetical protein